MIAIDTQILIYAHRVESTPALRNFYAASSGMSVVQNFVSHGAIPAHG